MNAPPHQVTDERLELYHLVLISTSAQPQFGPITREQHWERVKAAHAAGSPQAAATSEQRRRQEEQQRSEIRRHVQQELLKVHLEEEDPSMLPLLHHHDTSLASSAPVAQAAAGLPLVAPACAPSSSSSALLQTPLDPHQQEHLHDHHVVIPDHPEIQTPSSIMQLAQLSMDVVDMELVSEFPISG
jgi:hypothetical protein